MTERAAPPPRDFGRLGSLMVLAAALLLGVAAASFVAWEADGGTRLQVELFGENPPFVNGLPFLATLLMCVAGLGVSAMAVLAARIGDVHRLALGVLAFSLFADVVPYIYQLSLLAVAVLLMREGLRRGDFAFTLTPMFIPVSLVLVCYLVGVLKEPKFFATLNVFRYHATYVVLVVLLPGIIRTRRQLETLFHFMLVGACISATMIWIQLGASIATGVPITFGGDISQKASTPWGVMVRFTGLMNHPNHLSNVLASVAVPALWFATRPREVISRGRRILLLMAYVYLAMAVFLTFSRSGWLSLGVMSVFIPVLRWPRIAPAYLGGVTLFAGLLYVTGIAQEIYEIVLGFNKSSAEFRWHIDLIATQAFASDPWTGIGVGRVVDYFNAYQLPVHDTYLQVASELGIFGLVVIGGMVLALVVRLALVWLHARNPLDRDWAVALLLAGGITAIQSQFAMFLWMKFIWALFALMECVVLISRNQPDEREPRDLAFLPPRGLRGAR